MKELCDIFLFDELVGSSPLLKELRVFQREIEFDESRAYSGFLGLNLSRINAVSIVVRFRAKKVAANAIPIRYRDGCLLNEEEAKAAVRRTLGSRDVSTPHVPNRHPMFFYFFADDGRQKHDDVREGSNTVLVDRLDGHLWSMDEHAEYMHDYNHVI